MDSSGKLTVDELTMYSKQALENPALKMALNDLKEVNINKFLQSAGRDTEGREKIYWFLKALEEFKGQLNVYLSEEVVKKAKEKTEEEKFQERFDIA